MVKCDYCKKEIEELPWTCRRCGGTFCGEHRLPESHQCKGLKDKNFFEPLKAVKRGNSHHRNFKKSKITNHRKDYEMYIPRKRKHKIGNKRISTLGGFFVKSIFPKIQKDIWDSLKQFLLIFLIGFVLNYFYYQTFSLNYLFFGGVQEWFSTLITTLNGSMGGYNILYLMINGIYYFYFYSSLILVIYSIVINLDKKGTWIMLIWGGILIKVLGFILSKLV